MSFRALLFVAGVLFAAAANAQFPAKPVRIVVPYSPGGGTDIISRQLAQKLAEAWGQNVFVENRPGANGITGTDAVLKSPPDGHTLVVVVAAHVINASLQAKMPFDPVADVAAVTLIARSPWVIVITPAVPAKDLKALVAFAKANPGKLRFGSSEPSSRLAGEQFKQLAGIDLQHVPYKGGSQIMVDMLGGHIETGFTSTLTVLQHYKSGKLRVVAIAGRTRHPSMPDVPTAIEAGYPDYETYAWYGMYAPKGTPREVVSRIQQEISRVVGLADTQERLSQFGAEPIASSPEDFAAYTKAEHDKFAKLVKSAGIQPE
ncbi:MAG TPA: tripartite tricarboxylate transporter substrate binding protein [Burkholderiales bacterium]|nr:tripartite tricarboxylate transporter substrate binding protein [Burkholderiales bacterium]